MNRVHVVLPPGVDDPTRPSGGNVYDRQVCRALAIRGWDVREHAVPGRWPRPDDAARRRLQEVLAAVPDGEVVLFDGLVGSAVPEALEEESARLRLVVLVHLPLGHQPADAAAPPGERRALEAAGAVVTTSRWTRSWLLARYRLVPERVHVAQPGVDPAEPAAADPSGRRLLCAAAVCRDKGQDLLLEALAEVADLDWTLVCAGSLTVDPAYVRGLRATLLDRGLGPRVTFAGPLGREDLHRAYAASDLLVLASRFETYAMVVAEALGHGVPVLATDVGGVGEALGGGGVTVPADDPRALAEALRAWLANPPVRQRLRAAALDRRASLRPWADTAGSIEQVLVGARS